MALASLEGSILRGTGELRLSESGNEVKGRVKARGRAGYKTSAWGQESSLDLFGLFGNDPRNSVIAVRSHFPTRRRVDAVIRAISEINAVRLGNGIISRREGILGKNGERRRLIKRGEQVCAAGDGEGGGAAAGFDATGAYPGEEGRDPDVKVGKAEEGLQDAPPSPQSFWQKWQDKSSEVRAQVAKLGLAAVLSYGLLDGITYTSFFVAAFLGYEKSTGRNPAANLKALLGIVVLMWAGNNVTRPFRVLGAAAMAPAIDVGLKRLQKFLNLPNQAYAFAIFVASFASLCLSVVGVLILTRLAM